MAVERVKTVLDKVYNELSSVAVQLDNQIAFIKNITKIPFQPVGQMLREYAILKKQIWRRRKRMHGILQIHIQHYWEQ